jgi:hypothetical protein
VHSYSLVLITVNVHHGLHELAVIYSIHKNMLQFTDANDGFPKYSGSVGICSIHFFASSHQIILERCNIKRPWRTNYGAPNYVYVTFPRSLSLSLSIYILGEGNLKGNMTAQCFHMPLSNSFRILNQPN